MTRPQMFMEIAGIVAQRSTCMRLNVGAVIVHKRSIVAIGYNGAPAGEPHCRGNECPGKNHCHETIHAEMNAIAHLPVEFQASDIFKRSPDPLDLYVTDSPCEHCWTNIVALHTNIERVFFGTPYRISDHLLSSGRSNLQCYRITPAGYIMDWRTKELVDVET